MAGQMIKAADLMAALVRAQELIHAINDDLSYLDANMEIEIPSDAFALGSQELNVDTGHLLDLDATTYTDYQPIEPPPPVVVMPPSPVLGCCFRFGWRVGNPRFPITAGHIRFGLRGLEQWVRCIRLAARAIDKDTRVRT